MADHKKTVIFLHLPKTAGTTLTQIINRQYSLEKIVAMGANTQASMADFLTLSPAERAQKAMIYGHIPYGFHQHLPQPVTYFTFLREPVARTLSYFYFIHHTPSHYLYQAVTEQKLTLKDVLQRGLTTNLDNGQTRMLAGVWDQVPVGECTAEMLVLAQQHLTEEMALVGLVERFDESLLLLKRLFGWRLVYYTHANVTRNRPRQPDLDTDTLKAVAAANEWDMQLYQYAQQLFARQLAAQPASFRWAVRYFQWQNKLFGRTYPWLAPYWERIKKFGRRQA